MIYYALNLNVKRYVDILKNPCLYCSTSVQFEHENELRILRKRLEQVSFSFACIRCLSE